MISFASIRQKLVWWNQSDALRLAAAAAAEIAGRLDGYSALSRSCVMSFSSVRQSLVWWNQSDDLRYAAVAAAVEGQPDGDSAATCSARAARLSTVPRLSLQERKAAAAHGVKVVLPGCVSSWREVDKPAHRIRM